MSFSNHAPPSPRKVAKAEMAELNEEELIAFFEAEAARRERLIETARQKIKALEPLRQQLEQAQQHIRNQRGQQRFTPAELQKLEKMRQLWQAQMDEHFQSTRKRRQQESCRIPTSIKNILQMI